MTEYTDAEVFGGPPMQVPTPAAQSTPGVMTDAEVFGTPQAQTSQAPAAAAPQAPATTPAPATLMSDEQVFGTPVDPKLGGYPAAQDASMMDYVLESAKAVGQGFTGFFGSYLKGKAALSDMPNQFPGESEMEYQLRLEDWKSSKKQPIAENPLYKAGAAIEGIPVIQRDPKWNDSLLLDVMSGFGSIGATLASALAGGPGLAAETAIGSGQGQAVEQAVKLGATEDQIRRAAALGSIPGSTDLADLLLMSTGSTGKALGLIKKVGLKALQGAFIEGGQEGLQQFLQNLISYGVYNPNQDLMADVPRSMLVGAITGGIAKPVLESVGERRDSRVPTQEEIDLAFSGLTANGPPGPPGASGAPVQPLGVDPSPVYSGPESTAAVAPTEPSGALSPASPTAPTAAVAPPEVKAPEAPKPDLPSNVVDFIARKSGGLTLPSSEAESAQAAVDPNTPLSEEITASPGANTGRLAKLLGPKLYGDPTNMTSVTVKEILQNAFDAVKAMIEKGKLSEGKIAINLDPSKRTIQFFDNGSGMTPDVLGNQFLQIAGTNKESVNASGGLGIAKMLFLFGNKRLRIVTMRDGKVARMATTGEELFHAMDDKSRAPKIQISEPTAQERQVFADGHGTLIEVEVPKNFEDPSTGETKSINFSVGTWAHPVLQKSPLFHNIEVTLNGEPLNGQYNMPGIGKHFPLDKFTQFADAKFGWGKAHIYVTQDKAEIGDYHDNLHVLSNGLWQFSIQLKRDPGKPYGPNVQREFYVDLAPTVKPEDAGYPFDLNRQRFSKTAGEDLGKILNYMSALYGHEDLASQAKRFGEVYYYDKDGRKSNKITLEPKAPRTKTPANMIRPGDEVEVVNGRLKVNGRSIPELDPKKIKDFVPDTQELKVDPKEIDPNRVMVHDNVDVEISNLETKSLTQMGHEKFGKRFDTFLHEIGTAFKELRDVVAEVMGYKELSKEAIGISFDTQYRGVSIRLPFSGSFLNPAVPEYTDPLRAAVGMIFTMVHELAHHKVRSHDAEFPAEMQRILIHLDTHQTFDFMAFKQRVVNSVALNQDIFNYINGILSGAYTVKPRGDRFKEAGAYDARDASGTRTDAQIGPVGEGRSGLVVATPASEGPVGSYSGRGEPTVRAQESGPLEVQKLQSERDRNTRLLRAVDPQEEAAPPQPETQASKDAVDALFQATGAAASVGLGGRGGGTNRSGGGGGNANSGGGTGGTGGGGIPAQVAQMAAHADRINWWYKWMYGIDRLVDLNPMLPTLHRFAERIRQMHSDTTKIQDFALRIAKDWRRLGRRAEPLSALIDDVTNMVYRTPQEVARGVARHPTAQEFANLVRQHGVDAEALRVFNAQKDFFYKFLQLTVRNAMDEAQRTISDPVKLADKLDAINARWQNLTKRPYFPFLRFGRHFVKVKDSAGNAVFFQTYERSGLVSAERNQMKAAQKLRATLPAGHTLETGVLPETAAPFIGLPPELLESIQNQLSLTAAQKDAMEQIRLQFSPGSSFAHRFQQKNYVPGYSHDFLRAFSRYAFHGARYYARTKYAWALRKDIAETRKAGGNKAGEVANYMDDALHNVILDTKGDYGLFKGAIFLWVFGFSAAGAAVNLTQVPMLTYPFLADKFGGLVKGDARAAKALTKAMVNINNFAKKGFYENQTDFEMRAIDYGIKTGRITETQAAELAGLAQGSNLLGLGKTKIGRGVQQLLEKGSFLFEMAEQFNRRVTYRAALDLAMQNPGSIGVREAVVKYAAEYQDLLTKGFNAAEAQAVVSAIHATDQTQFNYSRENRPRIMRGRLRGTLFVFQTYMLNVLQLLGANKSGTLPRFLIMMMAMGGLMGLPGAKEGADLIHLIGKWLFGKDFNVELQLREWLKEMGAGDTADVALHGLARRGFGIPAILDMIGSKPGRGLGAGPGQNVPAPTFDMSRSLGFQILPLDLEKFADPNDPTKAIAEQGQRASGAIFGVGFNVYKALQDKDNGWTDFKRWEKAMPRALAGLSRGYRAYSEGRERSKGGVQSSSTIVNYDVRDPEQMAEVIGMGLGFQPLRQTARWDQIIAQNEVQKKFDIEREMLMKQMFEAQAGKDKNEIDRVVQAIRDYNRDLPQWAKGRTITADTVQSSMRSRARDRALKEAGLPAQKSNVGIARHIQELFPESVVDVRKVK